MKIFKTLLSLLTIFISFTDINAQVIETNRVYYNNEIRLTNNKFVFTTENVFWMDGEDGIMLCKEHWQRFYYQYV